MSRCQRRNALHEEKLWFRCDIFSRECQPKDADIRMMNCDEILNGNVSLIKFLI